MADSVRDWERIEAVLEKAFELRGAALSAYLDQACAADPALRTEVESVLEADRSAPAFLDRPAAEMIPDAPVPRPTSRLPAGRALGPFRVLREIGRGGMSTVYLAERSDGQFDQQVAIKVLMRDASSEEAVRRFRMERRILASLDHPGIVRIQDGGVVEDRPYLVMEYIEGQRIDRYCDAQRLSVRQRLYLFRQVLDAVASAHRSLVVHRDLKPDNILVTPDGRVRLLDFGIAKLLDPGDEGLATPTRTGLRPMTPEYASPEQVRGEPITTACDTYALGVLLYEMLTGHRPYAIDTASPFAVERAICESEPARPSSVILKTTDTKSAGTITPEAVSRARNTAPPTLQRILDGDLDAIVLKALRKEVDERYGSADAFREDVDRYLEARPVLARKGSRVYRIRKFARRHSIGVAMSAAGVIVLIAAFVAIMTSRAETERALVQAETEAQTSAAVTDFLITVFGGSDPRVTLGDTLRARDLLERGRARIDAELGDQPMIRASLLHALGRVYTNLGRHETADTLLQQAADLRTGLFGDMHPSVAETFHEIGVNHTLERNHADAAKAFSRALAIRAGGTQDSAYAADLVQLGAAVRDAGSPDSSAVLLERALAIKRAGGDTLDAAYVNTLLAFAVTRRAQEDYGAAEALYRSALPVQNELLGSDHPDVAVGLNNVAYLLTRQERWADAVPVYREALATHQKVFGPRHQRSLLLMANLANALYNTGREQEALDVLEERLTYALAEWPDGHWRVGAAYQVVGKLLLQMSQPEKAVSRFVECVESFRATIGANHAWTLVAETWAVLAMALAGDTARFASLDRAVVVLQSAELDVDTRYDLNEIAGYLEQADMPERAAAIRSLLD